MRAGKPNAPALNLREFFSESYAVPLYQREYSWSENEIDDLFQDLSDFVESKQSYYFLGQVIVADCETSERFYIVDGQQRTTSVLILLAAISNQMKTISGLKEDKELNFLFNELQLLLKYAKKDGLSPRVKVADDGNDMVIALIDESKKPNEEEEWSNTCENLVNAYDFLAERLNGVCKDTASLVEFYNKVVEGVIFVRLEVDSEEEAIGIYERTNNRGLELDSADLIKNTTFSKLKKNDFDRAASLWSKASLTLKECNSDRLRKMQFLLRAMLVAETGDPISSRRLREGWSVRLRNSSEALCFLESLPDKAVHLKNIALGNAPKAKQKLSNLGTASRQFKFVQDFAVLLAGAGLNGLAYFKLAELVENRVILSVLAAERPQDFERIVPTWANRINKLGEDSTPVDVMKASSAALKDIDQLIAQARVGVMALRYKNSAERRRQRFLLARITRDVEVEAKEANIPELVDILKVRRRRRNNPVPYVGYDLEHIRSRARHGDRDLTDSIGNLVLAHSLDQRAKGAAEAKDKVALYQDSKFLLTRSLVEGRSRDPKRKRDVIESIHLISPPSLGRWNDAAIERRAEMYWSRFESSIRKSLLNS